MLGRLKNGKDEIFVLKLTLRAEHKSGLVIELTFMKLASDDPWPFSLKVVVVW